MRWGKGGIVRILARKRTGLHWGKFFANTKMVPAMGGCDYPDHTEALRKNQGGRVGEHHKQGGSGSN